MDDTTRVGDEDVDVAVAPVGGGVTPAGTGGSRGSGRTRRVVLLSVVVIVAIYLVSSMVAPTRVPRLAVLPSPPTRTWNDGCNDHIESWKRSPVFWTREDWSTLRGCIS